MFTQTRTAALVSLVCLLLTGCPAAHSAPPSKVARQLKKSSGARSKVARQLKKPPAATKPSGAAASVAVRDPVEQNGPIFKGWAKPKLTLVFTGEQLGYIEPCGCAGLENQKGGLRRRATFLKQLAMQGWPIVALDNGGLIRRFGREAEIKFRKAAEGLKLMDYKAVGLGTEDLKLPAGALLSAVAESELFVSANTSLFDPNLGEPARFRVVQAGGMKVGVTAVLSDHYQKQVNNNEVVFEPTHEALAKVVGQMKKQKCDLYVLLAYATPDETVKLAQDFPLFNIAVMAHGADEPPHELKKAPDTQTILVEVGHKGMYAIALGFYADKGNPVRYQRVPLDHRFTDAAEMDELMVAYQAELEQLGWSGLGLRPAPHSDGAFAGSKACADCHDREYDIWLKTPHAHATETLMRAKPPRQFDPECISCHATGWNPQEFFPYETGFDGLKTTPHLTGNGCENCHGPAAEHVAAESGGDKALQKRLREALHLTATGAKKEAQRDNCMRCHDLDNSPKFDFDKYWEKVAH
ncbi:MAG TPA: multiheme c-type cytochrome [Pirellulales bacterium]